MPKTYSYCLIVLLLLVLIISAIPRTLNYQGKLLDSEGVGINDTLDITFRLFLDETGGISLWEQVLTDVPITKGLFSVELSSFPDTVDFSSPYWLEIQIGSELIESREKFTASPYSFYAIRAETADRGFNPVYSDLDTTRRTGSFRFRAGEGATMSDDGSNITITIGTCETGGTSGTIPSIYDVLIAGNNAGGYSIHNLLNPEAPQDVATKAYVDDYSVSSIIGGNGIAPNGPSMGDITLDINVDNSSVEIFEDTIRVKGSGIISSHIADGTIVSEDIGSREVQSSNIAIDNILREHIIDDAIGSDEIENSAIGYDHLADFTVASPSQGDVFYYDGSQWVNLGIGSAGQMLAVRPDGTTPYWETPEARAVFNYILSANPSSDGVEAGMNLSADINVETVNGTPQEITFYTRGLPTGLTANFAPSTCTPSGGPPTVCNTTMNLTTSTSSSRGTFPITVNGITDGGSQASVTYNLTIATKPGAISDLSAELESDNVILNWTAPSDNGGSLITNYIIYRGIEPNPTDSLDAVGSVLTYTDYDVSSCATYHYRVAAVNAIGEGVYSNDVSVSTLIYPTGGTVSTISDGGIDYRVHTFTSVGNHTFSVTCDMNVEVLVVAGGGGGGGDVGGGGGAGGLIYYGSESPNSGSSYPVTPGTISVTVGSGGSGAPAAAGDGGRGGNGGNSVFGSLTAIGGGGGGTYNGITGLSGGSGGGGGGSNTSTTSGGSGTSGQGYSGGNGWSGNYGGGSGGGAGSAGLNATDGNGRAGGNGLPYSISGVSSYYAGGGGAGGSNASGPGGLGGGGLGPQRETTAGEPGTPNTGGGGGAPGGSRGGGAGGSGIVIVRYPI